MKATVAKRLEDKGISFHLTDDAKDFLAEVGFDPVYGARPLKRVIQRRVQNPLAMALLEGEFDEGDTLRVSRNDSSGAFEFTRVPVAAVEPSRASA